MVSKVFQPAIEEGEEKIELKLRPQFLNQFIGQKKIKENLGIFIESARKRQAVIDHILLYGPPGLGKTTLANIVSKEMNVGFRSTSGPILSKAGDLAAILTSLQAGDILFIDEIHRLSATVEEILYSAMEDFCLDIIIGEGPAAKTIKIDLPKFTLIGATTRVGLLTSPLQDRFGINLVLNFYDDDELQEIIIRAIKVLGFEIEEKGAFEIAKRSRKTPRIALRLLRRVIDFAIVAGKDCIDKQIANYALERLEIDNKGLDKQDKKYLNFIAEHFLGGPVGIETIASGIAEERDTVEENIEPFLIQSGFINRTSRGRTLTKTAYEHLGIVMPQKQQTQESLF